MITGRSSKAMHGLWPSHFYLPPSRTRAATLEQEEIFGASLREHNPHTCIRCTFERIRPLCSSAMGPGAACSTFHHSLPLAARWPMRLYMLALITPSCLPRRLASPCACRSLLPQARMPCCCTARVLFPSPSTDSQFPSSSGSSAHHPTTPTDLPISSSSTREKLRRI
jgi:hypothetical protein